MKDIYILGVGHNTVVYIDLCEACGYNIKGLLHYNDEKTGGEYHGYKVLDSYNNFFLKNDISHLNFALSQGDNKIRSEIFDLIMSKGGNIPTLIHPRAIVSPRAKLGKGVVIHINAVVHPDTVIGDNSVMSYNTGLTHSSTLGKHCYLSVNSCIGAYTKVEDFVFVGIGAISISGKVDVIGQHAFIGAGALLTRSVEQDAVMMGIPAKNIKSRVM